MCRAEGTNTTNREIKSSCQRHKKINFIISDMPSERKLNVSLSMKIKGESTSVKVLPWDPFATFNVAVLIHSFVHIGCAFGTTILFLYS